MHALPMAVTRGGGGRPSTPAPPLRFMCKKMYLPNLIMSFSSSFYFCERVEGGGSSIDISLSIFDSLYFKISPLPISCLRSCNRPCVLWYVINNYIFIYINAILLSFISMIISSKIYIKLKTNLWLLFWRYKSDGGNSCIYILPIHHIYWCSVLTYTRQKIL